MKTTPSLRSLTAALMLLAAGRTHASPFTNGSFEQPGVTSGTEQTLGAGSTAVASWVVGDANATVYDAGTGFSAAQNDVNTRPWQYGYRDTLESASFTLMPTTTALGEMDFWSLGGGIPSLGHNHGSAPASAGYEWILQPNQLLLHPSSGSAYYCVLRWTAPADGTYAIHAAWSGLGGNSTVDMHVLVDGLSKDNRTLSGQGSTTTYDSAVPFALVAGNTIEFVVGSGDGNAAGDSTGLYATITAQSASGPGMVYVKDDLSHPAQAVTGAHLVSFGRNGGSAGTLTQTFDTKPGVTYAVNYRLTTEGANDDGQTMSAEAFDGTTSLGAAYSNLPSTTGQWSLGSPLMFTAAVGSTSTRLVFTDTTALGSGTNASWALDDVTVSVVVPGSANVWLAGVAPGTTARQTDDTTTAAPVEAPVTLTAGQDVTFDVIGGVIHNSSTWPGSPGPDGDTAITHLTENSIAELKAPIDSLVGVFLDANAPSGTPSAYLDFTVAANRDLALLEPGLNQPFFIGDGLTSTGGQQRVRIPTGATRLFLGGLDEYDNAGNGGSFGVAVNVVAPLPAVTGFTNNLTITAGAALGDDWTFEITQSPENAAPTLTVQTRVAGGAWVNIGTMTLGVGTGVWSLTTADIPLGDAREFRVLAEESGHTATPFTEATPMTYDVRHPAGPILYTRLNGATHELIIMQPDGTLKTPLASGGIDVQRCALSPDGRKIMFTALDGGLYVVRLVAAGVSITPQNVIESSGVTLNALATPTWSPDGQYVAFASFSNLHVIQAVDDNDNIKSFDEDTNPIIDVATTFDSAPWLAWSPDGTYLANTEGSTISAFQIMDEFGDITPVSGTNFSFPLTDVAEFATQKTSLAWSPDGQQIAFVQKTPGTSDTNLARLTVRDTSGAVTPESAANQRMLLGIAYTPTVSWSPDGSWLVLESKGASSGTSRVAVIRPEAYGPSNPDVDLTVPATDGAAFQPMFKQPVGGFMAPPAFTFLTATVGGNEEGAPIVVKVMRNGDATQEVTVDFLVTADPDPDGNSEEDVDFTITQGPLVFAAGETEKSITITPIDDAFAEGDGIIEIELLTPDVGDLGEITKATVTLRDPVESLQLPFVAETKSLKVLVNGRAKKKGKAAFDAKWRFVAEQRGDNTQPDLAVLIQYSATPGDEQSWKLIPFPAMQRNSDGATFWYLDTDDLVPGNNLYFRTITTARVRQPNPGPAVGPFNVTGSGLKLRVVETPEGDPTPTFDKKGVPTYTTFQQDVITYQLIYSNRGPAVNAEVNCSVPDGTHAKLLNFDPDNPVFDATPDALPVYTRAELTALKWNVGINTGERGSRFFKVVVDDDAKIGKALTGKANLLTAGPPKVTIKQPLPTAKVTFPFLLEPTATKTNNLPDNRIAAGDIITYDLAYENATGTAQPAVKVTCSLSGALFLDGFTDVNHDGKDDTYGYTVPGGLEPVFDLGTVPAGQKGNLTFKTKVGTGLKPGASVSVGYQLFAANIRKPIKGAWADFNAQNPLVITARRFGSGLVKPGDQVLYIVRAENQGSSKLTDLTVKFTVPGGVSFVSAGRGGVYDADFREVEWHLAEIAGKDFEEFGVETRFKYDYDLGKQVITGGDGSGYKGFAAAANIAGYQGSAKDSANNLLQDTGDAVGVEVSTDFADDMPRIGLTSSVEADAFVDVPTLGRVVGIMPVEHAPGLVTGRATVRTTIFNHGTVAATNVHVIGAPFSNMKFLNQSVGLIPAKPGATFDPPFSPTNPKSAYYDLFLGTLAPNEEIVLVYEVELPPKRKFGFLKQDAPYLKCDEFSQLTYATPNQLDLDCVPPVEYEIQTRQSTQFVDANTPNRYFITYRNAGIIKSKAKIEVPIPFGLEYAGAAFLLDPDDENITRSLSGDEALPTQAVGGTGKLIFDLGELDPNERGGVRVDLRVQNSALSKLVSNVTKFTVLSTMKGQYGVATGAQRERATILKPLDAPTNTTSTTSIFVGNRPPSVHLIRSAPQTVRREAGALIAYTIAFANQGDLDATGVEVGMQIPYGTDFVQGLRGKTWVPSGAVDIPHDNPFNERNYVGQDSVYWNIGSLPGHSYGSVSLIVRVNQQGVARPSRQIDDRSVYIKGTNFPKRGGAKIVTETRATNAVAGFFETVGRFFESIGSAFSTPVREAVKNEEKSFTSNAINFNISGADAINFSNGTFLIPIGNGRIVAGGGGNIVAAGGGNIVAGGGGNLVGQDGASIVAAGGGNIVAGGGGNLVGQDGASIVAGGGGNITLTRLANGSFTTNQILSQLVGDGGASIGTFGGNIVAAGGGNLVALSGPNKNKLIGNDGATFSASQVAAVRAAAVEASGGALLARSGSILSPGVSLGQVDKGASLINQGKGSVISVANNAVISTDSAGATPIDPKDVPANDGAGVVSTDGAGIVAAGGGNYGPK